MCRGRSLYKCGSGRPPHLSICIWPNHTRLRLIVTAFERKNRMCTHGHWRCPRSICSLWGCFRAAGCPRTAFVEIYAWSKSCSIRCSVCNATTITTTGSYIFKWRLYEEWVCTCKSCIFAYIYVNMQVSSHTHTHTHIIEWACGNGSVPLWPIWRTYSIKYK